MGQTERDEDEIRADLFFLPFILYHPYFILALTATATRYSTGDGPRFFLSSSSLPPLSPLFPGPVRKAVLQLEILSSLLDIAYHFS